MCLCEPRVQGDAPLGAKLPVNAADIQQVRRLDAQRRLAYRGRVLCWVRLFGTPKCSTAAWMLVCQPASPRLMLMQLGRQVPARLNLSLLFATWPLQMRIWSSPESTQAGLASARAEWLPCALAGALLCGVLPGPEDGPCGDCASAASGRRDALLHRTWCGCRAPLYRPPAGLQKQPTVGLCRCFTPVTLGCPWRRGLTDTGLAAVQSGRRFRNRIPSSSAATTPSSPLWYARLQTALWPDRPTSLLSRMQSAFRICCAIL